ncbi:MAG: sigma-70 family RNA polymerase sigma factor [Lachnospiraceae bacterium]|nr:sigma-70 family RNA polymerase sigma factor [Lachnospiraceae bacterium]
MSDTDISKELVQKAAKGDRAAFEELYQGTCRSVYFTCLNILKDEQEAQDITQDVYLTAFEQLSTLEDAGKFKPWLYRIAANKSIKRLKKKQPILPGDEQLEDMETEENDNFLPEEYVLNADKRELVLDIARKVCTDAQYQSILLFYFNELSIAEIAKIMECQENNVKKRLSIARAKIREGVLRYEKKSGDKLYSVAVIPFLTALFTAQMQDMQMPSFPLNISDAIPQSTLAASSAKTGGRIMLKGLQLKIAAGVAAAVVVGGVAAAVTITNQRAEEASAGAQEESTLDVAGLENTGDTETSAADTDVTGSDEDTVQDETGTASESDMTDESKGTGKAANKETEAEEEATKEGETAEIGNEENPESEQQYTYIDMSATMYATQTVNIRTLPSTDGEKVGSLSTNQEVNITGQCNETSWYRLEYNGQTAYVSNSYVSGTKIEVAAAEPAASAEAAPAQETASASASSGLPAGVVDLTTLPREQWVDRGDWLVYVHGVWNEYAISGQDIGPLENSFKERRPEAKVVGGGCVYMKDLGISYSTIGFTGQYMSPEERATYAYYAKYATKP